LKDIDKFLTSSTQVLKAFDECDFFASGIEARRGVWPRGQPSLGSPEQALKTIRTEIKNILRTIFLKDQRTNRPLSLVAKCTSQGF
jgi:hypothetical protein